MAGVRLRPPFDVTPAPGLSGRPLCVRASLRSFGRVAGGAATVVGALLTEGCTVLVPTFTFDVFWIAPLPHQQPARNGTDFVPVPRERTGPLPDPAQVAPRAGSSLPQPRSS
jgi:hypothetical protein